MILQHKTCMTIYENIENIDREWRITQNTCDNIIHTKVGNGTYFREKHFLHILLTKSLDADTSQELISWLKGVPKNMLA